MVLGGVGCEEACFRFPRFDPALADRLLPTFYKVADLLGLDLSKLKTVGVEAWCMLEDLLLYPPHPWAKLKVDLASPTGELSLTVSLDFLEIGGEARFGGFILFIHGDASKLPEVVSTGTHVEDYLLRFLERYRDTFGKSYVDKFISAVGGLQDVDLDKFVYGFPNAFMVEYRDFVLSIRAYYDDRIALGVRRKVNGIPMIGESGVSITRKPVIYVHSLSDDWGLFRVGSSEVRVSRDEAVAFHRLRVSSISTFPLCTANVSRIYWG